jgi:hypothetical protein
VCFLFLISTPKKPVRATHTPCGSAPAPICWQNHGAGPCLCPPPPHPPTGVAGQLNQHIQNSNRLAALQNARPSSKRTPLVAASVAPHRSSSVRTRRLQRHPSSATPPAHGPAARGRRSYNHRCSKRVCQNGKMAKCSKRVCQNPQMPKWQNACSNTNPQMQKCLFEYESPNAKSIPKCPNPYAPTCDDILHGAACEPPMPQKQGACRSSQALPAPQISMHQ